MASAVVRPGPGHRLLWSAVLAPVALALVALGAMGGVVPVFGTLPWVLATLITAGAWVAAGRVVRGRLRLASWSFAAAAAVAGAAHLGWGFEGLRAPPATVPLSLYALVLPPALIALGAALSLRWRRRPGWSFGVGADGVLVVLAASVGLLRWVVEPLAAVDGGIPRDLAVLAVLQSVTLVPVVPALLVVLQRRTTLPLRAAVFLLASTLLFAAASLFLLRLDPRPLVRGDALDQIALTGWFLLGLAGLVARRPVSTARAMLAGRRTRDSLRKLLVPGAAVFLAIVAVDVGVGSQPSPATILALTALGAVLALRTAHAFTLVDRGAAQSRQLAHTQALVEVTHSLAGTTDLDDTLRVISESARSVLATRAAGIELVTEDGQELVTRAAVGLPADVIGLRFPVVGSFTGWVVRHGEPRATVDPSRDPFIHPQSLVFLGHWPVAAAPIRFRGETLGALYACIRTEPFEPEELHLIGAMAEQAAIAIQNARLFEQVMRLSITDPLTGLANRRQLERELSREFAAAGRGRDLVAVIFDLDGFKDYNDAHGHLAGDEALQAFAEVLKGETRAMNCVARYGGDEFVALLGGAAPDGGRVFTQRIRDQFREASLALGRGEITVSAGLATWAPEMEHPDELLRRADDELYRAKSRLRT